MPASSTPSTNTMPFLNSAHSPTGPAASPFSPVPDSAASGSAPAHQPNGSSTDPHLHRGSGDFDDVRRGSTASNLHQGMNALGLGPTSPYHSNNHSQSSIVSGLQQQRGIQPNGFGAGRYTNMNGPISPYGSLRSSRGFTAGRVAPPILGIPKSEVYSADNPTRGQAYAFPDPDAPGRPPATGRPPSHVSRRNSFAESFTSSILTVESTRLPPGQQELPDSHHHSLMNKQIDSLRGDPDSPNGATPYSRTPELRVTHKLAERKRRSEMKDCFEQLRQRLPASQNNKSSKWETLSRAIDYISSLESQLKQSKTDADKQRHHLEDASEFGRVEQRGPDYTIRSMVTSISVPSNPGYPSTRQKGQLDKAAIFPLRSPALSDTATNISDSEGSSDQVDFYLEPYSSSSQEASLPRQHLNKTPRPNLNVVTEFSASQAEALEPGLKVEDVGAKRTAAKRRPKSIVSSKAEHINESGFVQRSKEVQKIKDLLARRANKRNTTDADKPNDDPSPIKPIVIGISVPKHEAEAHVVKFGDESAISLITPSTPRIVVTPPDADAPWQRQKQSTQLEPDINAVSLQTSNQTTRTMLEHSLDIDDDSTETPANSIDDQPPRQSSESQQPILPDSADGRPHSQGWWNLALSPMMSRAGTIKSIHKKTSPDDFRVPPLPERVGGRLSKWNPLESEQSPETPRRAGLADSRASTWSRWTSWEKTKTRGPTADDTREMPTNVPAIEPAAVNVGSIADTAVMSGSGLAVEYYHACAIEQLSGEPYFECLNHSCALKAPKLQSIFDRPVDEQGESNSRSNSPVNPPVTTPVATDEVLPMPQQTQSNSSRGAIAPVPPMQEPEHGRFSDSSTIFSEAVPLRVDGARLGIGAAKTVDLSSLRPGTAEKQEDVTTLRALEGAIDLPSEASQRPVPAVPIMQSSRYPGIAPILLPPPAAIQMGYGVRSPGPISPYAQQIMAPQGAVAMAEMPRQQSQQSHFYSHFNYPQRSHLPPAARDQSPKSVDSRQKDSIKEDDEEKQGNKKGQGQGVFARLKTCMSARKFNGGGEPKPKKTKLVWAIFTLLLLMIVGILLLTLLLTRQGDGTPVQQQWLNLTGYPPMPTGISTIIRPDLTRSQSECVVQNMWSCALPKENQNEVTPNNPDQPNFRFEIKFQNGSVASNLSVPLSRRLDNPFSQNLFTPDPAPPSQADQLFMGKTTDNITEPFNGEPTPFFMTFISAFPIDPNDPTVVGNASASASRLGRRQQSSNLTDVIPPPDILSNGSAAPANLLPTEPYPFSQPIRLYNRGLLDEHYGFYMYYDKAIFLSTDAASPNSSNAGQASTEDSNGGSALSQARARCTFSQTRFLVQIFTNPNFSGRLLGAINATANSAINYTPPGSFPYPTSIVIDRHGGNVNKKAVYCYGVDEEQAIQQDVKAVVAEFRGVGGPGLINSAPSLFGGNTSEFDQDAGGIDGGVGGCECQWQNWG
ncbi:hypothetical protein DV735_g2993, partial [Chaetothyriales sp. CBS 134920]